MQEQQKTERIRVEFSHYLQIFEPLKKIKVEFYRKLCTNDEKNISQHTL